MASQSEARFEELIDGYNRKRLASGRGLLLFAGNLLDGFKARQKQARKLQETTADDFNLLETLQISGDEIRHSMMLAWLFDCDATPAQDNLGFELFLKQLGLNGGYANTKYEVRREKRGAESHIDVEVAQEGKFIIHIENKIYSNEGEDQTKREWRDLLSRAKVLKVRKKNIHGFYLTLDGHEPAGPDFQAISWKQIANVLDEFAKRSKADQIRLFATHYAGALRRMIFEVTQNNENEKYARPGS